MVVPCFNYGCYLRECVESVLAQRGVEVRVLVIDDCSSDDSAEVGRRLAEHDDRVVFRTHRANAGVVATVNEGFAWAQGDYVMSLDADDQLLPDALERVAAVMAEDPDVGLVYGRPLYAHEGRPPPRPSARWRNTAVWTGSDWLESRCRAAHNCVSMPTAVIRRSVLQTVGGYRSDCPFTHDLNLWLRLAAVADVAHVRAHQAIYRVHASSLSHSVKEPLALLRERRRAFDAFFSDGAGCVADRERLQQTAARALARQALWRASRSVDRGEDERLVAALVAFALDTYSDSGQLREWRGLQLRRRIGAGRSLIFLPFLLSGVAHRVRAHAGWMLLGIRGI